VGDGSALAHPALTVNTPSSGAQMRLVEYLF